MPLQGTRPSFGKSLFVLGGARSGKSRHAQLVAETAAVPLNGSLIYIATAQAFDDEMRDRIKRHRDDRDARWQTIEAPTELAAALRGADGTNVIVLVDCLTLWLSNLLLGDADINREVDRLLATLRTMQARTILVSNEVGLGIVPDNALARRFRDAAGILHQRLAAQVDSVDVLMAGLVQHWKQPM